MIIDDFLGPRQRSRRADPLEEQARKLADEDAGQNLSAGLLLAGPPDTIGKSNQLSRSLGIPSPIVESDLPRGPRPLDIRETPEFLKLAQRVRDGLRAGHSYDD